MAQSLMASLSSPKKRMEKHLSKALELQDQGSEKSAWYLLSLQLPRFKLIIACPTSKYVRQSERH